MAETQQHGMTWPEFKKMSRDMKQIAKMLEHKTGDDFDRTLLSHSLFYSDCGFDPSPVIFFGPEIPLYVYVDSLKDECDDFKSSFRKLYIELKAAGFKWNKVYTCRGIGRIETCTEYELTQWQSQNGTVFHILFIRTDPLIACSHIYNAHLNDFTYYNNYIQPKYVCNLKTPVSSAGVEGYRVLNIMHSHADYVLGHVNDNNRYKCIYEMDYQGNDTSDYPKIPLFQQMYSYVF